MRPWVPGLVLAVVLAVGCGGAPRPTPASPEPEIVAAAGKPPYERIDQPSLVACGGCHTDVYREWSESLHHGAWTNANVRAATDNFAKESCRACHSPRSIFETGLMRRPGYRDFNQDDGVHCLSCHGLEGGVAATRTIPDAPCRPTFDARLSDADHCYPCHEPTHQAFSEYEESDAFALGIRCTDCHMPLVRREDGRMGRSHGPHGGLNAEFVKRSLRWRAWIEGEDVKVELANRTGHKLPGEIPSRSLLISVRFDAGPWEDVLLRRPNKGEDRVDDRLRPDEVRTLAFPLPANAEAATVRILFRPLPLLPAGAGHSLGEVTLALR